MTEHVQAAENRRAMLERMCPGDPPPLWCSLLTHYDKEGAVDEKRTLAHLEFVANFVDGLLAPGMVGDVWELTEAERLRVLGLVFDQATRLKLRVLVSVLKSDLGAARACLVGTVEWLKARTGEQDTARCLHRRRVAAFSLCLPHLAPRRDADLEEDLDSLVATGLPVALHLLPQTAVSPGPSASDHLVESLVRRHPNLLIVVDHRDANTAVPALAGEASLLLLREAVSQFAAWPKSGGGAYDGLLLPGANCFPRELRGLWRDLARKRLPNAEAAGGRIAAVTQRAGEAMAEIAHGDPLANAHRAIDHFMAFGPHAGQLPPPWIRDGHHLPLGAVRVIGDFLKQYDLLPEKGYLE